MILVKTERGRALLSDRRALSPRERQLLVLVDGRRSAAELGRWLGFAVEPVLQQMVRDGYLERARGQWGAAPPDSEVEDAAPQRRPTVPAPVEAAPSRMETRAEQPTPKVERQDARRSLAASKMYVVSLMQMLRDPDAASLAVSLHVAQTAEELVRVLADSLAFVHGRSGAEYAARVATRLLEVVPRDHLPALCDALYATAAPALQQVAEAQRARLQARDAATAQEGGLRGSQGTTPGRLAAAA